MIVIIAIAVLVLVVLAALFIGGAGGLNVAERERAFSTLCASQLSDCAALTPATLTTDAYDVNADGVPETVSLLEVCKLKGLQNEDSCKRACGCR